VREQERAEAEQQKLQWYAVVRILAQVETHCECGAIHGDLGQDVAALTRTFARDKERDAAIEELLPLLRQAATENFEIDEDEEGVEFDPEDLEDEVLDPDFADDPSLDIANGELTQNDLNPLYGDDEGGD
jgi:hypothetical protein